MKLYKIGVKDFPNMEQAFETADEAFNYYNTMRKLNSGVVFTFDGAELSPNIIYSKQYFEYTKKRLSNGRKVFDLVARFANTNCHS